MSVGAVAAIGGALITANAASKAAKAQQRAADSANQTQWEMYNQTREDNEPFRQTSVLANNRLAQLLGLGYQGSQSGGIGGGSNPFTLNDFIGYNNRIMPSWYNSAGAANDAQAQYDEYLAGNYGNDQRAIAERFGFDASAIDRYEAEKAAYENDPNYGALTRRFSMDDLAADVPFQLGHQYAQEQGALGVNRLAAASGSYLSGATLKALQDRGANIANQYAGDARNRYVNDQDNLYNRLAGLSGAGQTATNQVTASGQNYANQVSSNQIGVGNARGASMIAGANAINSGIGNAINYNQQQKYLNTLNNSGDGWFNNVYKKP